ncbi:hypothetical protein [Glycomyces sp. L485]|nr:hypothetical protein [Glycomyces sp. L485]
MSVKPGGDSNEAAIPIEGSNPRSNAKHWPAAVDKGVIDGRFIP